jgi:hypothetical protein
MTNTNRRTLRGLIILVALLVTAGCVERSVTINSRPSGALVVLNDQEVGRTPATVSFQWYGDYDVLLRLEGYETLKTHTKIDAPWYEYPPIDFVAEVFWPATVHDRHYREFELQPRVEPTPEELLARADEVRSATIGVPVEELTAPAELFDLEEPAPADEFEPTEPPAADDKLD